MDEQKIGARKNYIDNLRNFTILLLFPVHTFMTRNNFGSHWYIWQGNSKLLSTLIVFVNPWFMPILFVLAGMSARYALEKRSAKEFIKQRFSKLLIPFFFGLIFFVPFQTLYTRKFLYDYDGGVINNYMYFFTHLTDFTGYDGAFTPAHLWFILFLFIISVSALAVFHYLPYQKISAHVEKMPVFIVLALFIPIFLVSFIGDFGGFSLGKDFALYLIGYYVLSNDVIVERLENNVKWLTGIFIVSTILLVVLYYNFSYYGNLWISYVGWVSILVLIILGKRFFNKRTRFTEIFNKASYPIYILHQNILVVLAYYVVQMSSVMWIQIVCICLGSFLITVIMYHIIQLIPIIRKGIGIK